MISLGAMVGLLLIWSMGYVLVVGLAPGMFRPRPIEAAVALLLGLCATGLFTMITAHLAPDTVWFQRAIRWTIPLLIVVGTCLLMLRHRNDLVLWLQQIAHQSLDARTMLGAIIPWSSGVVLLVGTLLIVTNRPPSSATIELYGSRAGQDIQVSVTSTAEQEHQFVLVMRSASGEALASISLAAVSSTTGPVTTMLAATGPARIELYQSVDTIPTGQPLRWINFEP